MSSTPISYCLISKASRGDEEAYQMLLEKVIHNLTSPSHFIKGCHCSPSCPEPTDQQRKNLDVRLKADVAVYQKQKRL